MADPAEQAPISELALAAQKAAGAYGSRCISILEFGTQSMSSSDAFASVRAAAIDGRLGNVYWRQDQLRRLHGVLIEKEAEALKAIVKDSGHTETEAKVEYCLTLSSVKRYFSQLDPQKSLEDEYRIAKGIDALDRVESVGIVCIEPTTHTLFFSALSPLAAALAAGSCVILQLENTLREVSGLVRQILKSALDPDIFVIAQQKPDDRALGPSFVRVLQNGSEESATAASLNSSAHARTIAIVDRTADLDAAAKALVTARFTFGGTSSYAPDLVLVNEFVKTRFLNAVAQQALKYLTEENGFKAEKKRGRELEVKGLIEDLKDQGGARVITSGSNGSIVEIQNRNSKVIMRKIRERCLCVHTVSSLDDAIDLASREKTILATYLFSNLTSAKYLGQFITADATFINHVPLELLAGPAGPRPFYHAFDPSERYPTTLFTEPRPQHVNTTAQSQQLNEILVQGSLEQLKKLKDQSVASLPVNRPYTKGIGFFEQGILTGLSLTAAPILVSAGVLGFYGVRTALARWR